MQIPNGNDDEEINGHRRKQIFVNNKGSPEKHHAESISCSNFPLMDSDHGKAISLTKQSTRVCSSSATRWSDQE